MDQNKQPLSNQPPQYDDKMDDANKVQTINIDVDFFRLFGLSYIKSSSFSTGFTLGFSRDLLKHLLPNHSTFISENYSYFTSFLRGFIQKENIFSSTYYEKASISIFSNLFGMTSEWLLAFVITQHQFGYNCYTQEELRLQCEDPRDFFNAQSIALLLIAANTFCTIACKQSLLYLRGIEKEKSFAEDLYDYSKYKIGSNYNMIVAVLTHPNSIEAFERHLGNGLELAVFLTQVTRSNLAEIGKSILENEAASNVIQNASIVADTLWTTFENAREHAINKLDRF